jgi:hypothetical protein
MDRFPSTEVLFTFGDVCMSRRASVGMLRTRALVRFQEKWRPVFRSETRKKKIEPFRDLSNAPAAKRWDSQMFARAVAARAKHQMHFPCAGAPQLH